MPCYPVLQLPDDQLQVTTLASAGAPSALPSTRYPLTHAALRTPKALAGGCARPPLARLVALTQTSPEKTLLLHFELRRFLHTSLRSTALHSDQATTRSP